LLRRTGPEEAEEQQEGAKERRSGFGFCGGHGISSIRAKRVRGAQPRPAAQGNTLLPHEVQGIFSPVDKNRTAPLLDGPAAGGKI
jgi:hypothetical protein